MITNLQRILVIRRDNIGDLICTTPMLRLLRQHYPTARLDILVNSYNIAAIEHNPDLNQAYAYTKAKHRNQGQNLFHTHWQRLMLLWKLRKIHYDLIILAGEFSTHGFRLAQYIKPRKIITTKDIASFKGHEVERTTQLLQAIGINNPTIPALALNYNHRIDLNNQTQLTFKIGIHISARKKDQRWPEENIIQLIQLLNKEYPDIQILLFWSPGDEKQTQHPGDDEKAQRILKACSNTSLYPVITMQLQELIAGLDLCKLVVCSDGGAMHIAAALNKAIVCFFGSSDATRWYPWSTPHVLLQAKSQHVQDIGVNEALAAIDKLLN